jgi:hypothetical protein
VLLTAMPTHFLIAATNYRADPNVFYWLHLWMLLGTLGSIVLGIVATLLPLKLGIRSFNRMEF